MLSFDLLALSGICSVLMVIYLNLVAHWLLLVLSAVLLKAHYIKLYSDKIVDEKFLL